MVMVHLLEICALQLVVAAELITQEVTGTALQDMQGLVIRECTAIKKSGKYSRSFRYYSSYVIPIASILTIPYPAPVTP